MSTETHKPLAWMHEDGRVVRAETMEHARRGGGAMLSSLAGYTIPLYGPDALAAERERCAKLCESVLRQYNDASSGEDAARACIAAIRGTNAKLTGKPGSK